MQQNPPIIPVILSGGSGTRLWPLSQPARPKQFAPLVSEKSMMRETADRFPAIDGFAPAIIVGSAGHQSLLIDEANSFTNTAQKILLEPIARNTAPAIAAAANHVAEQHGNDALMLVLPADHAIAKRDSFIDAIKVAASAAALGKLVTFGIVPDTPHTGYGYIREGLPVDGIAGAFEIAAFVEKPNIEKAQSYLASGDYAWNSGMFLFKAGTLLTEIATHHPSIAGHVKAAVSNGVDDGLCLTLDKTNFAACDAISIDYAVMECTRHGAVVPADLGWSDIGAWPTLSEFATQAHAGNAYRAATDPFLHDAQDCFVSSTHDRPVALIGVSDLVVVDTPEGLLIVHKDRAQDVKHAADHFRKDTE